MLRRNPQGVPALPPSCLEPRPHVDFSGTQFPPCQNCAWTLLGKLTLEELRSCEGKLGNLPLVFFLLGILSLFKTASYFIFFTVKQRASLQL